jgi:hypothetical protein
MCAGRPLHSMNPDRLTDRAEILAPWIVGFSFALPILVAAYPPMDDLPLHEAAVGILRHWGDTRFSPPSVYELNLGHANQLFSLLVLALSFLVPIGWASKLVVAASLFALPLAAAHFAQHLGATRWVALLVAPLGLGWLFFWGLVQNILGLALVLALLPLLDDFAGRPTGRGALKVCGALLLLHFAHEAMMLVGCAAIVLCASRNRLRSLAWCLVPPSFAAAVFISDRIYDWRVAGPRDYDAPRFVFYSLSHKLWSIPGVLFGGFEPYVRNLMMVLALLPAALLLASRIRKSKAAASPPKTMRDGVHRYRFELFAALLFVFYLVAPCNMKSTTLIYHRFLPPAWAILVVCAGAGVGSSIRPIARVLCAALPVASLLIAWPSFADSDQVYRELDPLLQHIEIGSTVAVLTIGPAPHRLWSPLDASGHVVAVRGGKGLFDFTQSPTSPVVQRPEKRWVDAVDRVDGSPLAFRPAWDFTRFRYVLVRVATPGTAVVTTLAFGKYAKLIAQNGAWCLYESQLPLVSIDAPDAPLPTPPPPTLRRIFRDLAHEVFDDSEQAKQTPAEQHL